ncbi:MAG: RAD55 family ATPase, partial [Candidatus Njordarchaeales archaeon]
EPFVLPYVITDKGLSVIPPLPIGIAGKFSGEKIESGIPILDKYLGGGFQRGSATLIAGPTGAGKTLLALKIAINNIKMGRKVLFFSLKESEEQLREYVKRMGTKEEEYKDKLWFLSLNPFSMSEYVILLRTREMINKLKPDLYIIDGLEMFNLALGLDKAINYGFRRIQELKSIGITVIITETSEEPYNKLVVAPFVDNILFMEIVKDKMEYKKLLWILKLRGKPAPRTPLVIEDTEKGIELREL